MRIVGWNALKNANILGKRNESKRVKKNIAIIVQKLKGGGAERAGANLSIILSEQYHVHLIVFDGTEQAYAHGGILHDLNLLPQKGMAKKALQMFKRVSAIKKIKKDENIVCSISLMEGANMVNILSRQDDKVLVSVRNHISSLNNNPEIKTMYSKRLMQFISNRADKVIAVAYDVMIDCVENWGMKQDKVVEIPNLCDYQRLIEASGNDVQVRAGHENLVTMGRLATQKGQGNLLRAFALVLKSHPHANLYILGDGPLKPQLKILTQELSIAQKVIFLGYVHNPHDYIKACDVFVLPSLAEGMSNALLEALAFGMPCIATDCLSGMREILAPENPKHRGFLDEIELAEYGILTSVSEENVLSAHTELSVAEHQLAQAMMQMLEDEALRNHYHTKSLKRIQDFSPQKIVQRWIVEIEKL